MEAMTHDPWRVAQELREQLSSDKRKLAFFFGAGTSIAAGLPGIEKLTEGIENQLPEELKKQFKAIKDDLPADSNVEQILDRIRTYRELIGKSEEKEYMSIRGSTAARDLDVAICQEISKAVAKESSNGIVSHITLAQWIRALHFSRNTPVEMFTLNYDVLFEQAMEHVGVPFFDGFIGSVSPFFAPESVEAELTPESVNTYPPISWTRLWKLHGSINWQIKKGAAGAQDRITRLHGMQNGSGEELVIFPSREKYVDSRKLPFWAFQERLRRLLAGGECLLIILGYRFFDQHLNEIILQGLRSNPRLAITALQYADVPNELALYAKEYRNLSLIGSDKACIGGVVGTWSEPSVKRKSVESWPFWDDVARKFKLGDFAAFASFLELFIGIGAPKHPKDTGPGEEAPVTGDIKR